MKRIHIITLVMELIKLLTKKVLTDKKYTIMKKIFLALILVSLFSCNASRVTKSKEKIYKKENATVERYFKEYEEGKITLRDLQTLVIGSLDYVEYSVAPLKGKHLVK